MAVIVGMGAEPGGGAFRNIDRGYGDKRTYVDTAPNQTDQKRTGHVSMSSLVVEIWLLWWGPEGLF
jgi:hypothetical protein